MSVHDALPSDIYVDEHGKLWRCMSICNEPTRYFQEVESAGHSPQSKSGGVSGLMWNGWKRIYRPEARATGKGE
jgi:hypothetical protein